MNEQFSLHLDFQNFSMFTRLQRFEQCLHRQFFVPV
nr:MAG TPA: Macrophage scavenger receptor [Caudoviricetes sp.]